MFHFAYPQTISSSCSQTFTKHVMDQTALWEEGNVLSHDASGLYRRTAATSNRKHTNVVCEHVCMHVGWLEGEGILELNEVTSMPEGKKASAVGSPGQWTSVRCSCQQPHGQKPPFHNVPQLLHCSEPFQSAHAG